MLYVMHVSNSQFLNLSDCIISLSKHLDDKVSNYVYLVVTAKIEERLKLYREILYT